MSINLVQLGKCHLRIQTTLDILNGYWYTHNHFLICFSPSLISHYLLLAIIAVNFNFYIYYFMYILKLTNKHASRATYQYQLVGNGNPIPKLHIIWKRRSPFEIIIISIQILHWIYAEMFHINFNFWNYLDIDNFTLLA